mgnify:CR=1 FL=1
MYRALFDFDSVDGGDLSITVGDFLVLAEETPGDDGWYCCYNIRSSLVGLVPGEYVEQLPKEEFLPVSDDLLVRAPLECFLHSKNIYIQAPWVKGNLEKCISTPLHTNEALQQLKIHLSSDSSVRKLHTVCENKIWELNEILSIQECAAFVEIMKKHSALHHYNACSDEIADTIFSRLHRSFQKDVVLSDGTKLIDSVGINPFIRLSCFQVGQVLPLHRDAMAKQTFSKGTSRCSIVIYLNNNFEGGRIVFPDQTNVKQAYSEHSSSTAEETRVSPDTGKCVVFDQTLLHYGEKTLWGSPKFFLRTDLLFV